MPIPYCRCYSSSCKCLGTAANHQSTYGLQKVLPLLSSDSFLSDRLLASNLEADHERYELGNSSRKVYGLFGMCCCCFRYCFCCRYYCCRSSTNSHEDSPLLLSHTWYFVLNLLGSDMDPRPFADTPKELPEYDNRVWVKWTTIVKVTIIVWRKHWLIIQIFQNF